MPQAVPEGFLPKLGAIKTDGDLAEWGAAAAVPLRFASYLAIHKPPHTWNGPSDCGMEVYCGWNDEGLCLAGVVADDDVRNDTAPENSWQKDCLELFVDGRVGASFMKPPYTRGAYQMYVRPPVGGKAAELCVNPLHGAVTGARVAGKLVAGGWTFELVLPWSAFPGFDPRADASFGLQFGLDDYDGRDADTVQPLMISWQAATMLYVSPQKLVKWTLVDAFPKGAGTPLGTVAGIDAPSEVYESSTNTVRATIELGRSLAGQAASGVCEVKDWTGAVVAKGPVTLAKLAPPWQDSASGGFEWTLGSASDGVYTVEAAFADAQGAPLGVSRRTVVLVRFLAREGRAAADVDALRQAVLRVVPQPPRPSGSAQDMNLYSGDVHVHSGYSDGSSTPVGMALAAMYCGMDFVVITDHNTVDGAQVASRLFRDCGFDFPVVVGEEITTSWAHLNAYPLRERIPADLTPYATIRAVHQQGAVIQWNHPGSYDRDWYLAHGEQAMRGTGLDAWEHPMPQYNQWKKEGRLPTLVGSTDTHGATYGESERTLILAPSPAAEDVAEAVRRKAVLLVNCTDRQVFLGSDDMIARAVAALADEPAQMERRAARLKAALAKADLPALLRRSPAAVVKPADLPSYRAPE